MNKTLFSLLALCLLLFACTKKEEEAKSKDVYDVFLIMGQSNTEAGYGIDSSVDYADDGILQLGRNNGKDLSIIKAREPLEHWDPRLERNGFGLTFAKLYKNNRLPGNRKVLLIACGKGASGFNNSQWNKGDVLYEDAVKRGHWVVDNFPGSEIKAILWHQGEYDVGYSDYRNQLDSMVVNIRRDLKGTYSGTLPFIAGGLVPFWVMKLKERQDQQLIIENLPMRLPVTGFANPRLPFVIEKQDNMFDTIHYDAKGQRELGKRYFNTYLGIK